MRSKNCFLVLYLIFSCFILSSCWDREELSDIALILAIGIDYKSEEEKEVSIEIELPGSVPSGPNSTGDAHATFVQSATGKTISDAISKLQSKPSRRLFFSHIHAVIINEDVARKMDINNELEYLSRSPEARLRARIYVTTLEAKEVLSTLNHLRDSTAVTLRKLADTGVIPDTTAKDVIIDFYSHDREVHVPMISLSKGPTTEIDQKQEVAHVGTAIFKDQYLVDTISLRLTRGLQWFLNDINRATVTIQPKEVEKGHISSILVHSKSKLIPSIQDGKWIITFRSESEDDIIQNTTDLSLTDLKTLESIENQIEEEIINRLKETVEKFQKEIKSDALGFGRAFYQKYPKEWKKNKDHWNEIFPDVEVKYEVKVRIRRIGLSD